MAHVYCPECGYNNPESAHFCAKCGAALVVPEEGESTEAFAAPDLPESLDPLEDLGIHGAALIVRSGGGRAGETFPLEEAPTTIGRSPECGMLPTAMRETTEPWAARSSSSPYSISRSATWKRRASSAPCALVVTPCAVR